MGVPLISSWMKETRHFGGIGIQARKVGAFVEIALMTRPRKIPRIVRAAMLSGNDVFHLEGVESIMGLTQAAVLAPVFCALAHQLTQWKVYPQEAAFFRYNRALACRMAIKFPT